MVQEHGSTEFRSINCYAEIAEFSMKRWKIIVIVVSVLLVGGIVHVVRRIREMPQNAYAQEWVGGIVVDYLRQNDDRWPRSWEDLRPIYEQHVEEVGNRPWTFEELQSRVVVQWDVDVTQLRKASSVDAGPPFSVIRLRDGTNTHWSGFEPNEMVRQYLIKTDARQPPSAVDTASRSVGY